MSHSCNVCLEEFRDDSNPAHLCIPCGHNTCKPCLDNWFETNVRRSCPECRGYVTSSIVNRSLMNVISAGVTESSGNNKITPILRATTDNVQLKRDATYELISDKCDFAIYVIDNSGSMDYYLDGKTFTEDRDGIVNKKEHVTRWEEAVSKTIQIALYNIVRNMPASYYLLNPSTSEWIQDTDYMIIDPTQLDRNEKSKIIQQLENTLLGSENIRGNTPLDRITSYFIHDRDCFIRPEAEIICYNIITDGEPNDKRLFEFQLRELCRCHKVWLVINLCTDDDIVVEYYNDLDSKLGSELSGMDVLDDLESEANEVWNMGNRFFNYSLGIHICRMAGCFSVVSDWMDEVKLQPHYADKLIRELTGTHQLRFGYPEYIESPLKYLKSIDQINVIHPRVYSVLTRRFVPLINKHWLHYRMLSVLIWKWFHSYGYGITIMAIVLVTILI